MGDPHILAYTGLRRARVDRLPSGRPHMATRALAQQDSEQVRRFPAARLPSARHAGRSLPGPEPMGRACRSGPGRTARDLPAGAFMGTARIMSEAHMGLPRGSRGRGAAGAGALVVWLIRLLMWALARMRQSRSPTPSEDAPTEPLGGWGSCSPRPRPRPRQRPARCVRGSPTGVAPA